MAEAPSGPPRKTTTYNRFSTMASQNERYNTKDDEFFWLENIMRVAPHKLHSVPGPGAPTRFPLTSICTDSTERGQQNITVATAFIQSGTFPGTLRTSWGGYISDSGEFYSLIGDANCGGGNMSYDPACCQVNRYENFLPTVADHPPLVDPDFRCEAVNTRCGFSDVPLWRTSNDGVFELPGWRIYYPLANTHVLIQFAGGAGTVLAGDTFTKLGDRIYAAQKTSTFGSGPIGVWDANISGPTLAVWHPGDSYEWRQIAARDSYLYCLGTDTAAPHNTTLFRVDLGSGTTTSTKDLTSLAAQYLAPVNDDLVYFLTSGTTAGFYYIDAANELVYVGKVDNSVLNPFSGAGFFNGGTFYFGGTGFAGFGLDVYKIAVDCPPLSGPLVASISTDASVPAGGSINVTWNDILIPDSTDRIQLQNAPALGELNFHGATSPSVSTGGAGSGTVAFPISGGTTPGNYIFQLVTENGNLFIANSNTFTVT